MTQTIRLVIRSLAAAAAVMIIAGCGGPEPAPPTTADTHTITTHETVAVQWEKNLPAALERARSENKPVLINFYADW